MRYPLINRRKLLFQAGGMALFAGLGRSGRVLGATPLDGYPFCLGVASGDPLPDGFVIWTRLATQPLAEHGGMPMVAVPVGWEVAEDEHFAKVVRSGEAVAQPELGHSVHVELAGLQSARRYWYRFHAAGEASAVGTVRSAPAAGAAVDRLRIGVAGCQHYENGHFTAYRHLSEEPELDAIFCYGDYIYEGRQRATPNPIFDAAGKPIDRRHVGGEIYSLDDYRRRYALYKTDANLQAAHHAAAFLSTWDDHEVDNNWTSAWDQDGTAPEVFALRRFAAMQAWYENMPVRRAQFPTTAGVRMHRRLDYGRLLRVHLLDTRQYRSDQRCEPDSQGRNCRPVDDPGSSQVMGNEQEQWLGEGLGGMFGWHLLAQQVMLMPYRYPGTRAAGRTNMDSWSGYPDARARLVNMLQQRAPGNVVIATGDVHKHHAGVVPSREDDWSSAPVATEYVTTSVASGGDGSDVPATWEGVLAENPHTTLLNDRRGYQLFEIGPKLWRTDVVTVERISAPGATKNVIARLATEPGRPGVHKA